MSGLTPIEQLLARSVALNEVGLGASITNENKCNYKLAMFFVAF